MNDNDIITKTINFDNISTTYRFLVLVFLDIVHDANSSTKGIKINGTYLRHVLYAIFIDLHIYNESNVISFENFQQFFYYFLREMYKTMGFDGITSIFLFGPGRRGSIAHGKSLISLQTILADIFGEGANTPFNRLVNRSSLKVLINDLIIAVSGSEENKYEHVIFQHYILNNPAFESNISWKLPNWNFPKNDTASTNQANESMSNLLQEARLKYGSMRAIFDMTSNGVFRPFTEITGFQTGLPNFADPGFTQTYGVPKRALIDKSSCHFKFNLRTLENASTSFGVEYQCFDEDCDNPTTFPTKINISVQFGDQNAGETLNLTSFRLLSASGLKDRVNTLVNIFKSNPQLDCFYYKIAAMNIINIINELIKNRQNDVVEQDDVEIQTGGIATRGKRKARDMDPDFVVNDDEVFIADDDVEEDFLESIPTERKKIVKQTIKKLKTKKSVKKPVAPLVSTHEYELLKSQIDELTRIEDWQNVNELKAILNDDSDEMDLFDIYKVIYSNLIRFVQMDCFPMTGMTVEDDFRVFSNYYNKVSLLNDYHRILKSLVEINIKKSNIKKQQRDILENEALEQVQKLAETYSLVRGLIILDKPTPEFKLDHLKNFFAAKTVYTPYKNDSDQLDNSEKLATQSENSELYNLVNNNLNIRDFTNIANFLKNEIWKDGQHINKAIDENPFFAQAFGMPKWATAPTVFTNFVNNDLTSGQMIDLLFNKFIDQLFKIVKENRENKSYDPPIDDKQAMKEWKSIGWASDSQRKSTWTTFYDIVKVQINILEHYYPFLQSDTYSFFRIFSKTLGDLGQMIYAMATGNVFATEDRTAAVLAMNLNYLLCEEDAPNWGVFFGDIVEEAVYHTSSQDCRQRLNIFVPKE